MPFRAVETQRLYQQVAEQISKLIGSGELASGQRLPAERDLAAKLGVSRPTIREAMIALEIAGLVEVRTGSGIFVRVPATAAPGPVFSIPDAGVGPLDLLEARRLIECQVAARAAEVATDAQLDAITQTLVMMTEAETTTAHREADRLFHRRIAEAARNAVVVSVVDGLWTEMFSPMFERMGVYTGLLPESGSWTAADHSEILSALKKRDGAAARDAMDRHLGHVEDILFKESGIDGATVAVGAGEVVDADA